ncbi:hypothetical protein MMC29_001882 [Sticta canariensis]|nr:hypothetical protein [Sticta canariensis]
MVAKLFRGEYTTGSYRRDPDLATVQASDVRACLFHMADTQDHPIYRAWNSIHANQDIATIYNTIQPLKEAGEPFRLQYNWNKRRQISEPNWTRYED